MLERPRCGTEAESHLLGVQCCSALQPAVCLMLSSGAEISLPPHEARLQSARCPVWPPRIREEVSPEQELRAQGVVGSDSRHPGHPVGMALVVILRGSTVEFLPQSCESSIHTRVCAGTRRRGVAVPLSVVKVRVTMDSGAAGHVMPETMFPRVKFERGTSPKFMAAIENRSKTWGGEKYSIQDK